MRGIMHRLAAAAVAKIAGAAKVHIVVDLV
jgi:hypothetical protein